MPWAFRSKKHEELKFTKVIDYKEGVNHQKRAWSVYKKWSTTPSEKNPETVFKIEDFDFLTNWAPQVRRSASTQICRSATPQVRNSEVRRQLTTCSKSNVFHASGTHSEDKLTLTHAWWRASFYFFDASMHSYFNWRLPPTFSPILSLFLTCKGLMHPINQ